jgi:PAS domain S-box-containing protein
MLDADLRISYVNRRMAEMTGFPEHELVGKRAIDLVYAPDLAIGNGMVERRRAGISEDVEVRLQRKDGSWFWGWISSRAVVKDGTFEGSLALVADVTERRLREEQLRISEARLRMLVDQSPLSIQVFAPDGQTMRVNKAWQDLWQTTVEALGGYNILQDQQLVERGIMPLIQGAFQGQPTDLPMIRYVPDRGPSQGIVRWVHAFIYPVMESGVVREVILCHQDVTEQRNAEEAIAETQQQLRTVQRLANIGAFEWDFASGKVRWLTELPVLRDVVPDASYDGYAALVHPEDRARFEQDMEQFHRTGELLTERRLLKPNGEEVWLATQRFMVRDSDGRPVRALGVAMDVTERRRKDEALRKSEKLAAAGRLAATIAHEINNPLEAVTNLLFLLRTEVSGEGRPLLETAEKELQRVAAIARKTLGFYREPAAPVQVNVPAMLEEVIAIFNGKFAAQQIDIVRAYEPSEITAVRGEVRQVIVNLIANAIDAMKNGGRLTLSCRAIPGGAEIVVADTGPGIPEDDLPRLFDAFFTTKDHVGTGLGLWVAKEIIEKHGGKISVESRTGEDHGATFCVSLRNGNSATASAA